jgi:hypothetical protein
MNSRELQNRTIQNRSIRHLALINGKSDSSRAPFGLALVQARNSAMVPSRGGIAEVRKRLGQTK